MNRRLKRLVREIDKRGIFGGIKWLITTSYHRLLPQKQIIWCTDLTQMDTEGFSMPDNLKIQRFYSIDQIDKEDLKTLVECNTELMGSAASSLIQERFDKGAVLWLYKENGILAGYRWTIVNDHVTPTYVPQTKTDVHTIGEEIFPAFRGRNLFLLVRTSNRIIMKNEGFKRLYSETYLWNKRAVKAIIKARGRQFGIATMFSLFGKKVVIWHDMSGKTDFS